MKVGDICGLEGFEPAALPNPDAVVERAYTGDLLSDVMGNAQDRSVLITIQAHKNTVAVASLVGIEAIIVCNGRAIPDDMAQACLSEGIALFSTKKDQFSTSCLVASLLGKARLL